MEKSDLLGVFVQALTDYLREEVFVRGGDWVSVSDMRHRLTSVLVGEFRRRLEAGSDVYEVASEYAQALRVLREVWRVLMGGG